MKQATAISLLSAEFTKRKNRNSRYSLRAFAKHLGVGSGGLSEILAGKRLISTTVGGKIADRLDLNPNERKDFFAELKPAPNDEKNGATIDKYTLLEADQFSLIAEWQHFAILRLIQTKDFVYNPKWIANRLGLTELETKLAINVLLRLELVEEKNQHLLRKYKDLKTSQDIPSAAIRQYHRQILTKASDAIEDIPVELRDFSSINLNFTEDRMPRVKKAIKNFRRQIAKIAESEGAEEVYNLSIQLFPLSKRKK